MVKVSDKNCAHWTKGRFDQTEKRWVQKFIMKEKKMGIRIGLVIIKDGSLTNCRIGILEKKVSEQEI